MTDCASMAEVVVSCLILAAGIGERLGLGSKGFLELRGRPLLAWIADKALQVADEVLVAVPSDLVDVAAEMLPGCKVIQGGRTRQDSIALLAGVARGEWLIVHDGARPFASLSLFQAVLAAGKEHGCAGAFLRPQVPVARIAAGRVVDVYQGNEVGIFQTPRVYSRENMQAMLLHQVREPGWLAQSEVQYALAADISVRAVAGESGNIKITTTDDWHLAMAMHHLLV